MNRQVGTGPGEVTPDGCAVDFYALLPPMGEPEIIHAAVPAGAPILELGCGTGRLLRPLAALGHPVHGVDESPAMLARIPDLPTTCAKIQTVRLDQTFGAVLLASTMINVDPELRHEFLVTCCRHMEPDGIAVFQQNPPEWFATVAPGELETGGIRRVITSARREGPRMHVSVEYHVDERVWTHAWGSYEIGEQELVADLDAAGLRFGRWLTGDHAWFTAHPAA
ncbi:MAG TPA: class I SAM-dependent methyltransferase [Streptosporangiaceae bacterium]